MQLFGFEGAGFRPLRMSQRSAAREPWSGPDVEYPQPMFPDGVRNDFTVPIASGGTGRCAGNEEDHGYNEERAYPVD